MRAGEIVRYVLFLNRFGQTRIGDLRIASDDERDWADAVAVAIDLALDEPATHEVLAAASAPLLRDALLANGLRPVWKRTIWADDPRGLLAEAPPIEVQPVDSDTFVTGRISVAYAT